MARPANYWILRGARGAAARTKYLQYLDGLGTQREEGTLGGNRPASVGLLVSPFGLNLGAGVKCSVSARSDAWGALGTFSELATRVATATGEGETAVKIKGYKSARFSRTTGIDATGRVKRSKRTGLAYLSYGGNSLSVPFGKKTGDTSLLAAYTQIRNQQAAGAPAGTKFHLIDEDV